MADDRIEDLGFPGRAWSAPDELGLADRPIEPQRSWGPWATSGWTLVILGAWFAVQAGVAIAYLVFLTVAKRPVDPATLGEDGRLVWLSTLASTPVMVALTLLLASVRRIPGGDYLGLRPPKALSATLATLGILAFVLATDGLTMAIHRPIVSPVMLELFRSAPISMTLAAVLICAPIGEELLFRGFVYRGLAESKWGPGVAIGLSSIVWAAIHVQYDLYGIATIYLMGLYLGTVRYLTGSTLLTIWLHFVANAVATAEAAALTDWLS